MKTGERILKWFISFIVLGSVFCNLHAQSDDSLIWAYSKLKRYEVALALCDSLMNKAKDPQARNQVLHYKIDLLCDGDDPEAAIEVFLLAENNLSRFSQESIQKIFQTIYFKKNTTFSVNSFSKFRNYFAEHQDSVNSYLLDLLSLKFSMDFNNPDLLHATLISKKDFVSGTSSLALRYFWNSLSLKVYLKDKNIPFALVHGYKSLEMADSLNCYSCKQDALKNILELYRLAGDFRKSFLVSEQIRNGEDSISTLQTMDLKKAVSIIERAERKKLNQEINKKPVSQLDNQDVFINKWVIYIFGLLLLVLLTLLWALIHVRRKKKEWQHLYQDMQKNSNEAVSTLRDENEKLINELILLNSKNKALTEQYQKSNEVYRELASKNTVLTLELKKSLCSSVPDIKKIIPNYYDFSSSNGDAGFFYSLIQEVRKLRPGKMFAEKGQLDFKGISTKQDWFFANFMLQDPKAELEFITFLSNFKDSLSFGKVKDYNNANQIISKCGADTLFFQNLNLASSFFYFDSESLKLNCFGHLLTLFIYREGNVYNVKLDQMRWSSIHVKADDILFFLYGVCHEEDYNYISEFLNILTSLPFEEQLEMLKVNQGESNLTYPSVLQTLNLQVLRIA